MGDPGKRSSEHPPTRSRAEETKSSAKAGEASRKDHAADKPGRRELGGILRELAEQQHHLD